MKLGDLKQPVARDDEVFVRPRFRPDRALAEDARAERDGLEEAHDRAEARAAAFLQRVREFIAYDDCAVCGLPNPWRPAADCDRCAKVRALFAATPPATPRR